MSASSAGNQYDNWLDDQEEKEKKPGSGKKANSLDSSASSSPSLSLTAAIVKEEARSPRRRKRSKIPRRKESTETKPQSAEEVNNTFFSQLSKSYFPDLIQRNDGEQVLLLVLNLQLQPD